MSLRKHPRTRRDLGRNTAVLADEDLARIRPAMYPDRFPALPDETRPFTAIEEIEAARAPRYIPEPEPAWPADVLPPVPLTQPAAIGLRLLAEMPGAYGVLPCGHCGTPCGDAPAGFAGDEGADVIGHLHRAALDEGWRDDQNLVWSCPACQQDPDWRARDAGLVLLPPRPGWDRWVDYCDRIGAVRAGRPEGLHPAVDHRGHQYAEHAWYQGKVDALRSRMALRITRGMHPDLARTITLRASYTDIDGLFEVAQANVRRGRHAKRPQAEASAA